MLSVSLKTFAPSVILTVKDPEVPGPPLRTVKTMGALGWPKVTPNSPTLGSIVKDAASAEPLPPRPSMPPEAPPRPAAPDAPPPYPAAPAGPPA